MGWSVVRALGFGAAVVWSANAVVAQDPAAQRDAADVGAQFQDGRADVQVSTSEQQTEDDRALGSRQTLLVQWVLAEQRAMIDLARWGRQRAEHPEVQRLVDTIVQDHAQLIESLERASDRDGDGFRERVAERRDDRRPRAERRDNPDRRTVERRGERERRAGDRREDRRDDADRRPEQRRDGDDRRSDTQPEAEDPQRDAPQQPEDVDGVLEQLAERVDRALDRAMNVIDRVEEAVDPQPRLLDLSDRRSGAEMAQWHQQIVEETKRVAIGQLEQTRRGAEFDAALVGMLTAAHIREQASLNVLSQQATGELQNVLQQAGDDVQHHLQQCELVMQQIERAKGRPRR